MVYPFLPRGGHDIGRMVGGIGVNPDIEGTGHVHHLPSGNRMDVPPRVISSHPGATVHQDWGQRSVGQPFFQAFQEAGGNRFTTRIVSTSPTGSRRTSPTFPRAGPLWRRGPHPTL